jgi:CRP-like cAMP-binding protein
MSIQSLEVLLKEHPFMKDLPAGHIGTLVGCASNKRFAPGEYLCREGEQADVFYLIRTGRVSVEIYNPSSGGLRIDTVEEGESLGWSWLVAPYRWHFDARAVSEVRAFALDAKCLRMKSEADHELGYQLLTRFLPVIQERLRTTRLKLLDLYGTGPK